MNLPASAPAASDDSFLARTRTLMLRLSLSSWILILVLVTVAGYGVFGVKYYLAQKEHRALLTNNSTYIELDYVLSELRAHYRIALDAAQSAGAVAPTAMRSAAENFIKAAKAAAAANKVPALKDRFAVVRTSADEVAKAIAASSIDTARVRKALEAGQEELDLLVLIADEGRKAEWANLMNGSEANFEIISALLALGVLIVGVLGYLVTAMIRHVFADVIRINAAIIGGDCAIEVPRGSPKTDTGQIYDALRVFRDNVAEKAALEANAKSDEAARASRQQRVESLIEDFRRHAQQLLQTVGDNMSQMQETAKLLAHAAEDTSARAGNAAGAVAQASMNVQTVAAASEELAASVSVIAQQVGETTNVVTKATEGARSTNESVTALAETAQKIGEIITLIRAIADQTNLLALNATIEAARAGDMGRGFAVVATEVKSLATQTAHATEDITGQIAAIQSSTRQAADAIKILAATMEEANAYTAVISESVEKQGSATSEISRNAQQAATETQKVTANMSGVTSAVGDTMQSAAMVERASADVADCAAELRQAVSRFLEEVAAA